MARRIRLLAIGLSVASALALTSRGDLQLEFEVVTRIVPAATPAPAKVPTEAKSTLRVILAPGQIIEDQGETRVVRDFQKRRIYHVAPVAKSYSDESLFSVLGFRVMEFENRQRLAGALAAAAVKENPMPVPLSEHLFSLDDPETRAKLDRSVKDGLIAYSWEGKPLLSFSEKGVPASAADRERFVRFLRYAYGGHPEILAELTKRESLPERLVFTMHDAARATTTTLTLKAHKVVAGPVDSLAGLTRRLPEAKEPLASLLGKVRAEGPEDHARRAEAIVARQKRALAAKKGLDVFLALSEYNLQVGQPLPGLDRDQVGALLKTDADLRLLLSALQPPADDKAAAAAIATLKSLRARAGEDGRHLLKVFEANNASARGEIDRAETLFLEALAANPSITGAWKDLGDLHFRRFDMQGAWLCWDAARAISPRHELLRPVNELESRLLKDHPEYFAAPTPPG